MSTTPNICAASRRMVLVALALGAGILFAGGQVWAQTVTITPTSVEGQNISTAAQFLQDRGHLTEATQIRTRLNAGGYTSDPNLKENAETSATSGNTNLSTSIVRHPLPAERGTPFNINTDFQLVLPLARTLFHENVHSNQSYMSQWWGLMPGETTHETEAWTKTIWAEFNWIVTGQAYMGLPPNIAGPNAISPRNLNFMLSDLISYVGSFKENNYYGLSSSASAVYPFLDNHLQGVQTNLNNFLEQQAAGGQAAGGTGQPTAPAPSSGTGSGTTPSDGGIVPPGAPQSPCPSQEDCDALGRRAERLRQDSERDLNVAREYDKLARQAQEQLDKASDEVIKEVWTDTLNRHLQDREKYGKQAEEKARAADAALKDYEECLERRRQCRPGTPATGGQATGGSGQSTAPGAASGTGSGTGSGSGQAEGGTSSGTGSGTGGTTAPASPSGTGTGQPSIPAPSGSGAPSSGASKPEPPAEPAAPPPEPEDSSSSCVPGSSSCTTPFNCGYDCVDVSDICTAYPGSCSGSYPGDSEYQLMMTAVPAAVAQGSFLTPYGDAESARSAPRARHAPRFVPVAYHPSDPPLPVPPEITLWDAPEVSADARNLEISLVSNGNSSGEAFQLQVRDPSGRTRRVALPEGIVLEPTKPGSAKPAAARGSSGVITQQLGAFCLQFLKLPPAAGMIYRVADQALQEKYKPLRAVLEAGRKLGASGRLHPDSNPKAYIDSIRQYALWAKQENWDMQKFGEMFVGRTKKNAQALKVKWTKEMENALWSAVPGRWRDITAVLAEAERMMPPKPPAKEASGQVHEKGGEKVLSQSF